VIILKDELHRIISRYFPDDNNTIYTFGDKERVLEIMRYFAGINQYDKPDAFSIIDETVFILEHFEFDSSSTGSNGSQQKREESKDDRLFQHIEGTEDGITFRNILTANYSIDNYRKNVTSKFLEHYEKLDIYREHLMNDGIITPDTRYIFAFFIEDSTLLGNMFQTDDWNAPTRALFLPCCDFFIDLFERSLRLDCVFCGSWVYKGYHLWYMDRTMTEDYRIKQIDTKGIRLCNFTPHHVGFKVIIPHNGDDI
jgi:hypothetical protein